MSPWTGWLTNRYQGVIRARACASDNSCAEAVTGIVTMTAATTSWASLFIASSLQPRFLASRSVTLSEQLTVLTQLLFGPGSISGRPSGRTADAPACTPPQAAFLHRDARHASQP